MLIGQLSKLSGFSRDTIRYYEKIGLIVLPRKARRENNYKDYPDEVLHQLLAIRKYKALGFTLEEIRELLVLQSIKVLDVAKLLQLIEIKITGVDDEIERLHALRMQLSKARQALYEKRTNHIIELPQMRQAA
jgi:MerR family transcriptional regulator, copper efflux regulator